MTDQRKTQPSAITAPDQATTRSTDAEAGANDNPHGYPFGPYYLHHGESDPDW